MLLFLFCLLIVIVTGANPNEDIVTNLPGLADKISFKTYSGYLKATSTKRLHYWYTETQSGSTDDPLVLWLNGGPGCSSMEGFLAELGPFHLNDDQTVSLNPNAWNKNAHMLFLESPVGVGYSYSTKKSDYSSNDDTTAEDNFNSILDFFTAFPHLKSNRFFVAAESYGGIYGPTLVSRILKGNSLGQSNIKMEGLLIGNGLLDYSLNTNSLMFFARYHALIGYSQWDNMVSDCCNGTASRDSCDFAKPSNPSCKSAVDSASAIIYSGDINEYDIYGYCYIQSHSIHKRAMMRLLKPQQNFNGIPHCIDAKYMVEYMNSQGVRDAIHVKLVAPATSWSTCSDVLDYYPTIYDIRPYFPSIIKSGVRVLTYNGDTDAACNWLGTEWAIESLKLPLVQERREWHYQNQIAGWVKEFKGLSMTTVSGTGHMAPQWRAPQCQQMMQNFIDNRPL